MSILDSLRSDVEQAIAGFEQNNPNLSLERRQNIVEIRAILKHTNPHKVKQDLTTYVESLSTGFIAIFLFLEVNRFKHALMAVIRLPKYEEATLLKTIILEMGVPLTHDNIIQNLGDRTVLERLDKLELVLESQVGEMATLQLEVSRLKAENQFLTKTIATLAQSNKALELDNRKLLEDKQRVEEESLDLKKKYEEALRQNVALKEQIKRLSSSQRVDPLIINESTPLVKSNFHNRSKSELEMCSRQVTSALSHKTGVSMEEPSRSVPTQS